MTADHPAGPARSRRRRRIVALLILLLLLVGAGAAVHWRLVLMEAGLRRLAAQAGLGDITLTVTRLDLDGARLETVRAGPMATIRHVDLDWSPATLFSRPISRMHVTGARLDLGPALRGQGGGRPDGFQDILAGAVAAAPHLPALMLDDAQAVLPLPGGAGTATAVVAGSIEPDPSGAFAVAGRLLVRAETLRLAATGADKVTLDGPFEARLSDGVVTLTMPDQLDLRAERLTAGSMSFAPAALRLTGAASPAVRLSLADTDLLRALTAAIRVDADPVSPRADTGRDPLSVPLALTGTLRLADGVARFDGTLAGPQDVPRLRLALRHHIAAGSGDAAAVLAPLDMETDRAQPGTLLPALARLSTTGGTVQGEGSLAWTPRGRQAGARVVLDRVSLEDADTGLAIDGLSGAVTFDRLDPPTTPPAQKLRLARIDAGVALDDVTLSFQLTAGATGLSAIAVESFAARFAGGTLAVRNGRIAASGDSTVALEIAGVDLARLLPDLGLEDAGGTGVIDGAVPIRVVDGRLVVSGASLAARGPGRLRIRSAGLRDALAGAGQEVALMLEALEDFRYDRLSLAIEKPADGIARLRLETFGNNPAVANGRPFAINLNLETDIDRIAGTLAEALRLPGRVLGTIVRGRR